LLKATLISIKDTSDVGGVLHDLLVDALQRLAVLHRGTLDVRGVHHVIIPPSAVQSPTNTRNLNARLKVISTKRQRSLGIPTAPNESQI
jgi:hypothetical protein